MKIFGMNFNPMDLLKIFQQLLDLLQKRSDDFISNPNKDATSSLDFLRQAREAIVQMGNELPAGWTMRNIEGQLDSKTEVQSMISLLERLKADQPQLAAKIDTVVEALRQALPHASDSAPNDFKPVITGPQPLHPGPGAVDLRTVG